MIEGAGVASQTSAAALSGPVEGRLVDRIADIWGQRTPHAIDTPWPVRVDTHLDPGVEADQVDRWVQAGCVLCSNGCALDIAVKDERMVGVRGRGVDLVNHGRLGPKGLYGSWNWETSGDRLTRPLIREGGRLVETDWDTAMGRMVQVSQRLLREKGPLSHGIYTTGQLFIEEYYTLAVLGKAGIGTPHMDGNTRLCTATAGAAMKESFGSDGQPGSYTDIDSTEAIFLYGHNMAETQTVLWMRVLDRLHGPDRPAIVCMDPRLTPVAREADVHLTVRPGTNMAAMNALLREVIHRGWVDGEYVAAHTVMFDDLARIVEPYTPRYAGGICDVEPADLERAAELFGTTDRVLSTVLQGFYQSNQATAAACQVNNLHLLRGMLGRPGAGILQMNGQPTAQNTRETGADGDMSAFRNWGNPRHIDQLAKLWNVDADVIPHWSPPTHAAQIFRYAEEGSIGFLWISGTNPAVSMPDSGRIRRTLAGEQTFVVVQDVFLTETARLADVVLPAAGWGGKTGTMTNVNRTVHICDEAVEPPGEARPDFDIFLDYARRMGFTDRDGRPLLTWTHPEEAFEGWKECTRGRPCDYTGLTYDRLRGGSGIPWPVNDEHPDGTARLYGDGVFPTETDYCETYGQDLLTGAAVTEQEHRAMNPAGRALLKGAPYVPAHEEPDDSYPLRLTTGRTVYHFHTRTKTDRAPQLHKAAPDSWVELSVEDAAALGIAEGDLVRVESRRGAIEVAARIGRGRPGVVFVPFHYGYWDEDRSGPDGRARAANELTLTSWDPVSRQPQVKNASVRVLRLAAGTGPSPAPTTTASAPAAGVEVPATVGGPEAAVDEHPEAHEPPRLGGE